jgi:prepilin-type processing-associated H-X9-DG protein
MFVMLLPYLEETTRYAGFDPTKSVFANVNLPTTSGIIPVYLCPSMRLPREVPATDCSEQLAPGSYLISTRTDYAQFALSDPATMDGAFEYPTPEKPYRLDYQHFDDGLSKTLLIGETNYGFVDWKWEDCPSRPGQSQWGDQTWADGYWALSWGHIDWDLYRQVRIASFNVTWAVNKRTTRRVFRSDHPGGAQFVFVDGSVHFVSETIEYPVLRALVTRAGGEADHGFDW